jgi:uncharacterized membrane protein YjjP (DUF1212 family)
MRPLAVFPAMAGSAVTSLFMTGHWRQALFAVGVGLLVAVVYEIADHIRACREARLSARP